MGTSETLAPAEEFISEIAGINWSVYS